MGERLDTSFYQIHTAFAATEHGQVLAQNVRYERYKPTEVSNERWVELLGADVNNLTHMPLTYGLTKSFIEHAENSLPGFLTPHESEVLQVSALIHDWAEVIVGDITYSDKTPEDESEERQQLTDNIEAFYTGDVAAIKQLINEAIGEVIFSPDSKLGKAFNVIERVGYVRTALRASQHVLAGTAPDCEEGLRWLVADVFSNHPVALVNYAEDFPPVKRYLLNQSKAISHAFKIVSPEVFRNYPPQQAPQKEEDFYTGSLVWRLWLRIEGKHAA